MLLKPAQRLNKPRTVEVARLTFNKLLNDKDATMEAIERAYSEHGLGTLAIEGVPGYCERRRKALLQAWQLANLPREARRRLERPEHYYQVGWEHGEYGFKDGRDAYMGSFFSNPLSDTFLGEDGKPWRNAWPTDDLPSLKPAVQELSLTMKDVAQHLARYLDHYVRGKLPSLRRDFFERTVASTPKVNSRLIHYYPIREAFSG
jgi:isopenicillin N synthase-like dioxygenase